MKKILLIYILILGLITPLNTFAKSVYDYTLNIPVNNKYKKIKLEAADSEVKRIIGLMYRKKLKKHTGMIFLFKREQDVNFWMKNVNFPLDIIYLKDNKVVKVYRNVPPCSEEADEDDKCTLYPSEGKICSVIEIAGGSAEKYGIYEGQVLRIERLLN